MTQGVTWFHIVGKNVKEIFITIIKVWLQGKSLRRLFEITYSRSSYLNRCFMWKLFGNTWNSFQWSFWFNQRNSSISHYNKWTVRSAVSVHFLIKWFNLLIRDLPLQKEISDWLFFFIFNFLPSHCVLFVIVQRYEFAIFINLFLFDRLNWNWYWYLRCTGWIENIVIFIFFISYICTIFCLGPVTGLCVNPPLLLY